MAVTKTQKDIIPEGVVGVTTRTSLPPCQDPYTLNLINKYSTEVVEIDPSKIYETDFDVREMSRDEERISHFESVWKLNLNSPEVFPPVLLEVNYDTNKKTPPSVEHPAGVSIPVGGLIIVAGRHRIASAKSVGVKSVLGIILTGLSIEDRETIALGENTRGPKPLTIKDCQLSAHRLLKSGMSRTDIEKLWEGIFPKAITRKILASTCKIITGNKIRKAKKDIEAGMSIKDAAKTHGLAISNLYKQKVVVGAKRGPRELQEAVRSRQGVLGGAFNKAMKAIADAEKVFRDSYTNLELTPDRYIGLMIKMETKAGQIVTKAADARNRAAIYIRTGEE